MFGHDNQDDNQEDELRQDGGGQTDNGQDQAVSAQKQGDEPAEDAGIAPSPSPVLASPAATDDLLDIKQEALQALTPLVGQLDQTPEEQFRTTMMMIQASDNHALVKVAYDAAKQIANEKERAQALLDIVNEINYFTQHAQA